jgi:DNA repair protein RecN (Recombination protein N)
LVSWRAELVQLDAATDSAALERAAADAERAWRAEAQRVSKARKLSAPKLADAVTQAMQQLGMAGGRFEVALIAQDEPQAFGLESVELRVAGHAGSTPRALAKVASGGELSRLALAIAVTTARTADGAATLIFDEIDAGIGGAVADTVGRLMKQLGQSGSSRQVLAVTHLAQVAACGDHHFVVSKQARGKSTQSDVHSVAGEARVAEVARMLGGDRLATSVAHAQEMLGSAAVAVSPAKPRAKERRGAK